MVAELCAHLQKHGADKYSLEMQIWWRDHRIADKERVEKEIAEKKLRSEKEAAIAKLTPYERKLLGL